MQPVLIVIAGPNGSGKTTVTARLRLDRWSEGVEYLNPDDVARDRFGDWNSPDAVMRAAKWTQQRREELLAAGTGIAFETVFSTPEKLQFVERARVAGYFVRVFFVGTSDPAINAARIAHRYMAGGHHVPIEKIVDRYQRSLANLPLIVDLAQRVYVFDNSIEGAPARLCIRMADGGLRKIYGPLPDWVAVVSDGLRRHPKFVDLRPGS
ncbi:MAG: zeta toxin family protein [Planctomycetota bacterium]